MAKLKRGKLDIQISEVARKAVHLAAPKGFVREITRPKGKKDGGRGRPKGTFKTRVLPSGRVVKVHTSVYKKMLAQEKATMRLIAAQKQAMLQQQAEQMAMQTDPRFQPSMEDAWAEAEDMDHLAELERMKQEARMKQIQQQMGQLPQEVPRGMPSEYPQEYPQQGPVPKTGKEMFSKFKLSLMGTDREAQLRRGRTQRSVEPAYAYP